ncbi:MAG TPA: hypothetical protein VFP89_09690 [Propionibacteriaceae bacterium]|nr:hypothetical protein [Propionibacteriaceae bacterium]
MPDKVFELRCDGTTAAELYPDVEFVEVDESLDGTSFAVRLRLHADASGEWDHVPDERFTPFTPLGVSLGFTGGGGPAALVEGWTVGSTLTLTGEEAYLDVLGQDAWAVLDQEEKVVAWPDLSDADIAQQILSGAGLTADVTPTSPLRAADMTTVVQRGTDGAFLRELARRNGFQVRFGVAGGRPSARFGPPQLDGSPLPDLAVRFGAGSNLRSFRVTVEGRHPLDVSSAQVDPLTRQPVDVEVSRPHARSTGRTALADLTADRLTRAARPLKAAGNLLLAATAAADPTELQARAQAARDEAAWFVEAAGEVNSDAYGAVLRAGRTVLVKGAGSLHSGLYQVTRVVHRMHPAGEYRQRFEARRNAVGLDGTERFAAGSGLGLGLG